MNRQTPRAESVLAAAAAIVGVIGIASALTPEFANRYDFVRGVLPPGVPHAARIVALAFGIALIWLSRSLARRRDRASRERSRLRGSSRDARPAGRAAALACALRRSR
jgi:lysylphosphatidylglycerol synthetase-like protein (DUF2156 family)